MRSIDIAEATSAQRLEVAELYAEVGYDAPIDPSDTVMVASSHGQLIGAVRLCREHGVTVLRGMQIRSELQRQGIGTRLLAACLPHLGRGPAFCLPYSYLTTFYEAVGFEVVGAAGLPDFLARRLDGYLVRGLDVVAMWRKANEGRDGP